MRPRICTTTVAFLAILSSGAHLGGQTSQAHPTDLQGRSALQLGIALPRKWDASLGYEVRMVGDASTYRGSYFSGELGHPVGKHLNLLTTYRLGRGIGRYLQFRHAMAMALSVQIILVLVTMQLRVWFG